MEEMNEREEWEDDARGRDDVRGMTGKRMVIDK